MARSPKREVIALDAHIWTHVGIRALSDSAALAYIYLIAWSRAVKKNGVVTPLGAKFCDAGEEELNELLNSKPEAFLVPHEEGWLIPKWGDWQIPGEEPRIIVSEVSRAAGVRGAEARKETIAKRVEEVTAGLAEPAHIREEWLKIAFGAWPEPGPGYRKESDTNVRSAFYDSVKTTGDWEGFQAALEARLNRYKADPDPRDRKRKYLGSFQKFCSTWRDQELPIVVPMPDTIPPPAPTSNEEDVY